MLLRNETEISGLSLSFAGDWFVGVIHKGDPEDVKAWSSRVSATGEPMTWLGTETWGRKHLLCAPLILSQSGDELGMAIQDAMGSVFEELAKEGFDAVVHSVAWSPVEDRMVVALLCLDTEGVRKIALVSGGCLPHALRLSLPAASRQSLSSDERAPSRRSRRAPGVGATAGAGPGPPGFPVRRRHGQQPRPPPRSPWGVSGQARARRNDAEAHGRRGRDSEAEQGRAGGRGPRMGAGLGAGVRGGVGRGAASAGRHRLQGEDRHIRQCLFRVAP